MVWEGRDDELGGYLVVLDENTSLLTGLLILFYFNRTVSTRHGVFLSMVLYVLIYLLN